MTELGSRLLAVTLTASGREMAAQLPWPSTDGALVETVRSRWATTDGFILFATAGIAVRAIAPMLSSKTTDPAVVCVDERGRWCIPLVGGHAGGANALATQVAALLGAQAVLTTATDASAMPPLDTLTTMTCEGDVAAVTTALLDGNRVTLYNPLGWPLPDRLADRLVSVGSEPEAPGIVVTDGPRPARAGVVTLHPRNLVVGVGSSSGAPADDLLALAESALSRAHLTAASVVAVATLDHKASEPAIVELADRWSVPLVSFTAAVLSDIDVPTPSEVVRAAVGTPSVSEAAAIHAAGTGADLVVTKVASATATVAVARRRRPAGHLFVVGLGPGDPQHRTPAATAALRRADVVIGYGPYIDLAGDAVDPAAEVIRSPIGDEVARSELALERTSTGQAVALVCSGDAGVYALATLVFELAPRYPTLDPLADIEVVPGVTAALTSAAVLGAPLGHDHVAISLSDLLTPWEAIERRLRAAAEADLVVSLYNPRSAGRTWQLGAAMDILAPWRPPETPVGIVTDAGRPNQHVSLTTMTGFDPDAVGMTSCVIIGASTTTTIGGRMVTPRGYQP
ncbi:MAG: precorrin-3B C(17)-methyltransferase [Acidimicrobiales bacterium]